MRILPIAEIYLFTGVDEELRRKTGRLTPGPLKIVSNHRIVG
jgi:hypothetical protein